MGTLSGEETRVERRKRYSRKFQRIAVERMRTCESVGELAKELGVTRRTPLQVAHKAGDGGSWRRSVAPRHIRIGPPKGNPSAKANACREGDGGGFFKGCLAKNRGSTPAQQRLWRDGIYQHLQAHDALARPTQHRAPVPVGSGEPQRIYGRCDNETGEERWKCDR